MPLSNTKRRNVGIFGTNPLRRINEMTGASWALDQHDGGAFWLSIEKQLMVVICQSWASKPYNRVP